ncbi:MAG: UDP-N-acetylglucosamine 2-epimerase [Nitrosopumilales archaeon]|nr:MAG: UDP-N-acetylglucosamine 2-epimerase [Nitrosopumilales archaeon]
MKVSLVVGTRPQIIKSQPLIKKLLSNNVNVNIIHTGQHYDFQMSKSFFSEMKINDPDINLGIKSDTSLKQLAMIISKLEKPLKKFNPDYVIVPGDTRSALGAALAASRLGLKLVHMEAGARSNDIELEEEINRRIIDQSSSILFAPTKNCYDNLKRESVLGSVFFTGDTMYDVFLDFTKKLNIKKSNKSNSVLITIHRRNNIENYSQIKKIIQLVNQISKLGNKVTFPIHPHTKKQIKTFGLSLTKINTTKPVKYSQMLKMLSNSNLLITDSGGLQKEAYWLNTPCITLRKSTEWVETLREGQNILLDKITKSSLTTIKKVLSKKHPLKKSIEFGRGDASKKMVSILFRNL